MYGNTGIDFRSEPGTKTGPPCDEEPDEGPWEPPASGYCTTDDVNQRRTVTKTQGGVISTTVETRTVKGTATNRPPCELLDDPDQGRWGDWIDITLASDICSGDTYYPEQRREHTDGRVEYRTSDTPRVGTKPCPTLGRWKRLLIPDYFDSPLSVMEVIPGMVCIIDYENPFNNRKPYQRPASLAIYVGQTTGAPFSGDGPLTVASPLINPPPGVATQTYECTAD